MYAGVISIPVTSYPRLANSSECRPNPHARSSIFSVPFKCNCLIRKSTCLLVSSSHDNQSHLELFIANIATFLMSLVSTWQLFLWQPSIFRRYFLETATFIIPICYILLRLTSITHNYYIQNTCIAYFSPIFWKTH